MSTTRATRVEKAADVLYRYMRARHRFKEQVERPLPAHELAVLIAEGKREFDEIYVEPESRSPIVLDGKADDVYAAIPEEIPLDPVLGPATRCGLEHHVISNGPLPLKPEPRRSTKSTEPPDAA